MVDYKKQGKKNRASGQRFELKVRKDLEDKGWIVDKWSNNVEFTDRQDIIDNNNSFMRKESAKNGMKYHDIELKPNICGKLIPAKNKFRGLGIPMMLGSGFPDFVAFRIISTRRANLSLFGADDVENLVWYSFNKNGGHSTTQDQNEKFFEVIGVEVKSNGYLDKTEKEKCRWLLENNIFSKILIASKDGKKIKYEEFK